MPTLALQAPGKQKAGMRHLYSSWPSPSLLPNCPMMSWAPCPSDILLFSRLGQQERTRERSHSPSQLQSVSCPQALLPMPSPRGAYYPHQNLGPGRGSLFLLPLEPGRDTLWSCLTDKPCCSSPCSPTPTTLIMASILPLGFRPLAPCSPSIPLLQYPLPDSHLEAGCPQAPPPPGLLIPFLKAQHCFPVSTFTGCPRETLSA